MKGVTVSGFAALPYSTTVSLSRARALLTSAKLPLSRAFAINGFFRNLESFRRLDVPSQDISAEGANAFIAERIVALIACVAEGLAQPRQPRQRVAFEGGGVLIQLFPPARGN